MAGLLGRACLLLLLGTALSQTLQPGRITHPATNWVNNAIELSVNNLNKSGVSVTLQFNAESALTAGVAEITFPSGFTISGATVTSPSTASLTTISSSVVRVTNLTWSSNTDNTIVIGTVQNPASATGYGPFGIVTRHSDQGQIVDCNAVFGSVGIAPQASTITSFALAYATGSSGAINHSAQSVEFTFTISKDLWKYDMFVITMSDKFQVDAGVTCESYVSGNAINYYNSSIGTTGVGVHTLDCSATAVSSTLTTATADMTPAFTAQKLYIYGNAFDIDADGAFMPDAKNVKLRISAITNPAAVYGGLSWAIETIRFQTNTIIEDQSSPSSSLTIIKGAIASGTYVSSWNVDADKLYNGAKAFMDASITTGNAVYRDSHAEITFTDQFSSMNSAVGSGQVVKCWMIEYEVSEGTNVTTCSEGTTSRIDITNMAANSAGKQFKFRVLADFQGTSSTIQTAKTMIATSNETIDESTSVVTLDRTTTYDGLITASTTGIGISTKNTDVNQHLKAGFDTGLAATDGALQFAQILDNSVTAQNGASVTISFPFNNQAGANDMWYFSTTNQDVLVAEKASPSDQWDGCSAQQSEDVLNTATWTDSSSAYAVSPGSSGNLGTIKLTLGTNVFDGDGNNGSGQAYLATDSAWCLEITQKNAGTSKVSNPQVMSNQSTYYELWVEWDNADADNNGKYLTTIQPTIAANVWQSGTAADLICKSTWKGTLINVFGKLYNTTIPSTPTYYVDVQTAYGSTADNNLQVDNAFGSGLTAGGGTAATGDSYPITAVKPSTTTAATLEDTKHLTSADSVSLRMVLSTSTDVTTNNAFEFSFPIGLEAGAVTTYTPTIVLSGFFFDGTDTRIRQEIYYVEDTDTALADGAAGSFNTAPAASGAGNTANDALGITLKFTAKTTASTNAQNDHILLVLPAGTQFGTSAFTEISAGTTMVFGQATLISSSNRLFAYPTAYAQITSNAGGNEFASVSGGTGGVQITNVTSRISSHTEDSTGVIIYDGAGQGTQCSDGDLDVQWIDAFLMYKTVQEWSSCEISLASTTVRAPGTTALAQEVSVRTATEIPEGGTITLIYDSGFAKTADLTTCTVTGLSADSTTGVGPTVTPTNTSTTTITSFAAVTTSTSISISCDYLIGPNTVSATQNVVQSLVSAINGNEINRWDSSSTCNKQVSVAAASTITAGVSSEWSVIIAPNNISQTNVNGTIKFKVSQTLPKGSSVTIAYPLTLSSALSAVSDIKDYVWSTVQYSAVSSSGNTLLFTPGEDVPVGSWIEIYIDAGFNTGADTTTSTNGFDVTASWETIPIIADPDTGYSASSKFTASAAISGTITDDSISIAVNNAGESSDYAFSWTSSVGYTVGDSIEITFPREFDLFVGDANEWFTEEVNTYYINCSSTAMGASWCKVDKRCVTLTGSVNVDATQTIDVTIHNVHNPAAASSRAFIVSQVAADGSYQAHDTSFNTSVITLTSAPAENIHFKSVSVSDHNLFGHSADYVFEFFLGGTALDVDEALYVTFPLQYDLYLTDGTDSYTCASTYLETSSLTASAVDWNSDTVCATDRSNTVKLDADESGETFTSAYQWTWTVSGVSNPEWGETRVAAITLDMDFDDTDFTLFTDYDDWTNKFWLSTYDASDKKYKQKSYDNLNSAYLGFNNAYDAMTVNEYNPQNNSNRIKVYAGSYTQDIVIKAESDTNQSQMQAQKIVLTASANVRSRTAPSTRIAFTSAEYAFTFFQEYTQINFKVGADINITKGLYYIDWSKVETGQVSSTNSSTHYHHPVRTLVEVVAKVDNKFAFTCETLGTDAIKGTSTPNIGISTTNSPFSDVTILFGLQAGNNANITFSPNTVVFGPNDLTKYYTINVTADYDISTASQQVVTFTRSGTDAEVFSMPENMTFNIAEQADDKTAGLVTSWGQQTCTGTSCSFSPLVSQTGSLWWAQAARQQGAVDYVDATCPPIDTIKANVAVPNATTLTPEQEANAAKTATDYAATETDPAEGETWAAFQQRKYTEHLQDTYFGVENIYSATIPGQIDATWLWAGTEYQICGYVENVYGEISNYSTTSQNFSTHYFETSAIDSNWSWSVTASGSASMKSMNTSTIRDIVSYYQGVNPERNTVTSNTETTSRRLQTTYSITWDAYLAVDRRVANPSTETIATLQATDITSVGTDLNPKLGTGNSMGDYATSPYIVSQVAVSFTTKPALKSNTDTSVTISFQSDNDYGETACVVVTGTITNNNLKPTATQVFLGLDRNNANAVSANKIDSSTTNSGTITKATEITVSNLAAATEYSAFCTASNGYPVFPSFVPYASDDNYTAVTFTTSGTVIVDDDDDFSLLASCNVVSLFLMITALIFN